MTRINQRPCFTFNEPTSVPRLGPTQGVNFLINFDYLATDTELKQPISITVHEPEAHPDIENFERKNFLVFPGTQQLLRLGSTVLDSTRTFDEISLDRRLCIADKFYKEIQCIMDNAMETATTLCGCKPSYIDNSTHIPCHTFGIICYEESIMKSTKNVNKTHNCYPACKYTMYSLQEAAKGLMTEKKEEIDNFGNNFSNFLDEMIFLTYDRSGSFNSLESKLKKTALVHINFDQNQVMVITKDAKITVPDMIGNMGGTLGVFLGFSFLGLLDSMVDFFQYLKRKGLVPRMKIPRM